MRSALASITLLALASCHSYATWTRGVPGALVLSVDEKAQASPPYSISVGGATWLEGTLPAFHCNQEWLRVGSGLDFAGSGPLGANGFVWMWKSATLRFNTTFGYNDVSQTFEFQQIFVDGCPGANLTVAPVAGPTATSHAAASAIRTKDRAALKASLGEFNSAVQPLSMFPSFNVSGGAVPSLRFYSWRGRFMHDDDVRGSGLTGFAGGQEGGPLLLHEDKADGSASALVLSPLDAFMSGVLGAVSDCSTRPRSSSCTIENNTDYYGNDVVMHPNVTSVGQCCDLCKANSRCTAFSWADERDPSFKFDCWLKDSTAGRTPEKHTSGYLCDTRDVVLAAGVQGQVQAVPRGFVQSFVVSPLQGQGLTAAMYKWGAALRASRNTTRMTNDVVSTKMGYGTDNGGYFFCNNVPHADNLTVTMQALRKAGVAVGSVQLDPYWYPDGDHLTGNCAVEWQPRPDLFPQGLPALSKAMGAPLVLYSALWCTDTADVPDYKGFAFVNSTQFDAGFAKGVFAQAAPSTSRAFYDHIMEQHASVLGGFETDFMDFSALLVPDFVTTVDAAHGWLAGMWGAAEARSVSSQQCMSLPSMILASLDFPSVTNARASEDDFPTNPNRWQIGYTSLLLGPVAVRPFFDVLWTAADQPGNPYGLKHRPNVRRDVQVATLSMGPVWIGDGPGMTDVGVVRTFAAADGTLLHPSRPATPVDAMYTSAGGPGGGAEVWSTHTASAGSAGVVTSYVVLAVDVASPFDLPLSSLWPSPPRAAPGGSASGAGAGASWLPPVDGAPALAPTPPPTAGPTGLYAINDTAGCVPSAAADTCTVYLPASETHLTLLTGPKAPDGEHSTSVVTLVPESSAGLAFLGLEGPVVRLSPQRVLSLAVLDGNRLSATIAGSPGEAVQGWFVVPGPGGAVTGPIVVSRSATVGPDGTATLTSPP